MWVPIQMIFISGSMLTLLTSLITASRTFDQVILTKNNADSPVVLNTWPFTKATDKAWSVIDDGYLAAVEAGCRQCQTLQCDGTVGWGGSPDEHGETTQDAMIMDGVTHGVGAVGGLRQIKDAIGVARAVMEHTEHTLLVGDLATEFAVELGFPKESLKSNHSHDLWINWKKSKCQPNFWKNVSPDPTKSCGPYKPDGSSRRSHRSWVGPGNHDTIGIVVVDAKGRIAAGTSSNGANHKISGRVGDAPIMGAGAYADQDAGAAAATGDGDVMMRFLPSYHAVTLMATGITPSQATATAIKKIAKFYPNFSGALVAVNTTGGYGAACHGLDTFHYSVRTQDMTSTQVLEVPCV